ncbi:MAG: tRNA preQ1(34) S-adenosylmethionine ribosyltransferase-isomerase QueA [Thermodesulfovibrio sp.]|nr:tRNA preQ1(34) S-adenosylmethionine ribosyltransferase-isomerase QueA [Thermodesulfovibrio sp.]
MKTADFNFDFPKELIALRPAGNRDHSRLLVLHRSGDIEHKKFFDIHEYLKKGDMLLLNDTKVFPARIISTKPSGGKIDILLVRKTDDNGTWEIMCRSRFQGKVNIGDDITAEIWTEKSSEFQVPGSGSKYRRGIEQSCRARKFMRFLNVKHSSIDDVLWHRGYMPLPPYINRLPDGEDRERYQTVFAEKHGSIAAPTAGLHFTEELLSKIADNGVMVRKLTLHIGTGTFKPIKTEFLEKHSMDSEYFEMKTSLIEEIQRTKESGHRLITVGTTATRAIEGFMGGRYTESPVITKNGAIKGFTDIFIYPGYEFKAVDSLITNFHLPHSTPLMLVSAFSSFEMILKAYEEAVAMGYRFFSYGDAMLIL